MSIFVSLIFRQSFTQFVYTRGVVEMSFTSLVSELLLIFVDLRKEKVATVRFTSEKLSARLPC